MIKTAIIGASGFIGGHLWRSYREQFPDCIGTSFSNRHPELANFDIRNPEIDVLRLEETGHRAVVIASANPDVSYCERDPVGSHAVNVEGTLELIRRLSQTSLQVIFLSSDYVFDGSSGDYDDDARTNPGTEYGRQKKAVENELPSLTENHLMLRLSKVFGLAKSDTTLLDQMAKSMASGIEVSAAGDQVFCPTYVGDVVSAVHAIQERRLNGVMNLCAPERLSRFELAGSIAEAMNVDRNLVNKVSLYDIPSMEGRPLNTSMLCSRFQGEVDVRFTPLGDSIERVAKNYSGS